MSFVQPTNNTNDAAASSIAATFGAATTAANVVTGVLTWFNASGTVSDIQSITDNASPSNTYSVIDSNGSTSEGFSATFSGVQTNPATVVTVTFINSSPSFRRILIQEYSSSSGSIHKHTKNRQVNPGTGANVITSGSVTTTVNGCQIVGYSIDISSATTIVGGSSYTKRDSLANATDNDYEAAEDTLQATAGAIAATFTSASGSGATFYNYLIALAPPSGGSSIAVLASAYNQQM